MIRFQDSQPQTIYLSQHDKGTAYVWDAIVKTPEGVPTAYSSYGDHASYALVSPRESTGYFVFFWELLINSRTYHIL